MSGIVAADRLVDMRSPAEAKIALFRSLFVGRQDVFARRFASRATGKSGYQPACANEWVPGVCHKPRIRCGACTVQKLLPMTGDVVKWHLSGRDQQGRDFVAGVSATMTRKDGHHPIIFMQCGPVRHRVDARLQAAQRPFAHEVMVRPTAPAERGSTRVGPRREQGGPAGRR